MTKYQEALDRISNSFMNDNNDYRQYLDSKSAFDKDVEVLQELVDKHNKLEEENQKQKEILDTLKPRIYVDDITIKLETLYKCFNEEQYTELKEWKEND